MAENAYTLGLGKLDIPKNVKTDVLITLDILGGAAMADPYAGLVTPPFLPPNRAMLIVHSSSIGSNLTSSKRHHERIHLNPSLTYQI